MEFPYGKFWKISFATPAVGGLVLMLEQWANHAGSPANDNIHHVEILQKILART